MLRFLKKTRWLLHPVSIMVLSIVALGHLLFWSLYWSLGASARLQSVVHQFNLEASQFIQSRTWVMVLVLSILVAIILSGIIIAFVYLLKTIQLNRLQQNFINNFTHELKTPVTSLRIYLETFLKYDLDRQDQQKYLTYMIRDVERLSDNIHRMLNLGQIESNRFRGDMPPSDIFLMIEEFVSMNRHLFSGCDISVRRLSPGAGAFFPINQGLFEMLLMNLITNAITYNESASPKIDITVATHKNRLEVRFADNGIGIPARELRRIFRKFYQVGMNRKLSGKGSGLGLYVVAQIARVHKGKIVATSQGPGKGTTFVFSMPLSLGIRPGNFEAQ